MADNTLWIILESATKYLILPFLTLIVTGVWWLFKKYDKRIEDAEIEINNLKKELTGLKSHIEMEVAVLETKLDNLMATTQDIKIQLQRLFDILEKRR